MHSNAPSLFPVDPLSYSITTAPMVEMSGGGGGGGLYRASRKRSRPVVVPALTFQSVCAVR